MGGTVSTSQSPCVDLIQWSVWKWWVHSEQVQLTLLPSLLLSSSLLHLALFKTFSTFRPMLLPPSLPSSFLSAFCRSLAPSFPLLSQASSFCSSSPSPTWSHHRHRRSETSLDVWQGRWICKRLKHRNSTQSGKADRGVCCVITTSLSFSHSLG